MKASYWLGGVAVAGLLALSLPALAQTPAEHGSPNAQANPANSQAPNAAPDNAPNTTSAPTQSSDASGGTAPAANAAPAQSAPAMSDNGMAKGKSSHKHMSKGHKAMHHHGMKSHKAMKSGHGSRSAEDAKENPETAKLNQDQASQNGVQK